MLVIEEEFAVGGIVGNVTAGGLVAEPFADVAFRSAGFLGEFSGSLRAARSEGFVEAEFVTDTNEGGVKGGAKVSDRFDEKFVETIGIYSHGGASC